jgi:hypothetical protein
MGRARSRFCFEGSPCSIALVEVGPLLCDSFISNGASCCRLRALLLCLTLELTLVSSCQGRHFDRLRGVGVNFEVVGNPGNGVNSENGVNSGNGADFEHSDNG